MNATQIEAAIREWVEAQEPKGTVITIDMADAEVQQELAQSLVETFEKVTDALYLVAEVIPHIIKGDPDLLAEIMALEIPNG